MTGDSSTGLLYRSEKNERASVPLTGVSVHADIVRSLNRVHICQRYENRETKPIEAVYVFPLEAGSAICSFSVKLDEKRIEGHVLPRDEAFDRYDDAMAAGHGAFLLDQERPNIFTASVGNVLPGQSVEIELAYLSELPREGSGYRLTIPTTISPRYVPASHRDFEGMNDAERIHPPISVEGVPYRLELDVKANLLSPIRSIESPSHKIRSQIDENTVEVRLAGDEGALDRDFVLLLTPTEASDPVACLANDAQGDRFAMLSFAPQIKVQRNPGDITFVVDCSGSMIGPSIEEARRTLLLCLQSLEAGDRFDIVRFGSTHESLFGKSVDYDDESLESARTTVRAMRADLNGTEILEPLAKILERRPQKGLSRRIVLITDGQVTNEDQVTALAREHRGDTRIFAFGVGPGASEHLIRSVARASGGAAELVYPGETIDDKVLRHFDRMTRSCAGELSLSWDGLETEDVYPAEIPPLTPGVEVTFMARVRAGTVGRATISGEFEGREFSQTVELSERPTGETDLSAVPLLWARRRIRDLEESEPLSNDRGSRQSGRRQKKTERELVRLGERYGLVSSATSYVAIEERDEAGRTRDRAELRRVPAALTTGWGGIQGVQDLAQACIVSHGGFMGSIGDCLDTLPGLAMPPEHEALLRHEFLGAASSGSSLQDTFHQQNADGSWDLEDLEEIDIGKLAASFHDLRAAADQLSHPDAGRILATLIVLSLVTKDSSGQVPRSFRPAVRKARRWLKRVTARLSPSAPHTSWEAWAAQFSTAVS